MFGGKLPNVRIEIVNTKTFHGQMVSKTRMLSDGRVEHTDFVMKISDYYDTRQEALEDIIIHEMIHCFIQYNSLSDTAPHGKIFLGIMESINQRYKRHITVSVVSQGVSEGVEIQGKPKWHVIAILKMSDGRAGLKVLPRRADKIKAYYDTMLEWDKVDTIDLYMHYMPWFDRFPTSAVFKAHILIDDEYKKHLVGASRLSIIGNDVVPGEIVTEI